MSDKSILKCPNCHKELKWLPKGKHMCSCGEIISTTGEDLKEFALSEIKIPFKDRTPSGVKIQLALAIILVLALFVLRVLYQEKWLQYEADFMFMIFSIDPASYKQVISPFVVAAILVVWFVFKFLKKD
ncbi:MAG: hypothetical protein V3S16_16890 [Candidatus Desulfatibia sp.]|uniref:hypothetical protein n=1 Tax=Candidatus Desulfatibia sp. TaxID=3101189 RepID=UPI002F33D961